MHYALILRDGIQAKLPGEFLLRNVMEVYRNHGYYYCIKVFRNLEPSELRSIVKLTISKEWFEISKAIERVIIEREGWKPGS